jgi:O-antigen/teichoic acid export membrane protein
MIARTVAVSRPARYQTMKFRLVTGRLSPSASERGLTSLAMALDSQQILDYGPKSTTAHNSTPGPRWGSPDGALEVALAGLQEVPADGAPPAREAAGAGSKTLRNTVLILAARVASRLLTLVSVLVMVRHLQPAGLGTFQDVVNETGLVTVFIDVGFNTLFQREAARRPGLLSHYLSRLVTGRAAFALLAFGALSGVLAWRGQLEYLVPAFLMMALASYGNLLRGALYAVQRLRFEAVAIVLESAILLGLVAYGVLTRQGVTYFLYAYAISYGFSLAYFAVVLTVRRVAAIRPAFDPIFIANWLMQGLPFAATFVITTIYFKIDVPILAMIRGHYETGLYVAAYKPFEALLFIPVSMLNVVFPVLAVYHRGAEGRLVWAVNRFYKALLALGCPIAVGTFMLSGPLQFIYVYPESQAALQILAVGIVLMFVSNAFIGALNAIDRQLTFTWAALVSMVVNIGLNLALIPAFGYLGASWATVLTELALFAMGWWLTARHLTVVPLLSLSWRILLASLVMGAALYPLRDVHGPMIAVAIVAGALVYGLALLLVGAADAEEMRLLRRAVHL